jgi:hypothetical protein
VLIGAIAMQVTGIVVLLGYYWADSGDGLGGELAAVGDWAPIPTGGVIAGLVLAVGVVVGLTVSMTRQWLVAPVGDVGASAPEVRDAAPGA